MDSIKYLLIAFALVIVAFFAILIINAIACKRKAVISTSERKRPTKEQNDKYVKVLGEMIKCQTIADDKHGTEFEKFRQILKSNFPLLHKKATLTMFDDCLIYKIKGKNTVKNIMLMSHHDVVDGLGEWKHNAFLGEVVGDVLWGRGTIDTKTPLFAELQAVEELIEEGFDFIGFDLYIGSSGNEEVCGNGIPMAVQRFKENNIKFDIVLDEGGAIIQKMMPGVKQKSAMVAVHEKGRHTFVCTAKMLDKGHTGFKVVKLNPVERMSAFITEVKRSKIFKATFVPEVEQTFTAHAPYMTFPFRFLFSNIKVFRKMLLKVLPKISGEAEGMLKTTLHFTSFDGQGSEQRQAKEVRANMFCRCLRVEHLEQELEQIKAIAKKYEISIEPSVKDYCKPTSYATEQFAYLKKTLNINFPDVIVSPFLLTAGTDARHFTDIADNILRFAPIDLSPEQFKTVHNVNENIDVVNVGECVCFYKDFIKNYNQIKNKI